LADRVAKIYDWIKETIKANAGDAKERLQKICNVFPDQVLYNLGNQNIDLKFRVVIFSFIFYRDPGMEELLFSFRLVFAIANFQLCPPVK
jgi:hypothetical protein